MFLLRFTGMIRRYNAFSFFFVIFVFCVFFVIFVFFVFFLMFVILCLLFFSFVTEMELLYSQYCIACCLFNLKARLFQVRTDYWWGCWCWCGC